MRGNSVGKGGGRGSNRGKKGSALAFVRGVGSLSHLDKTMDRFANPRET